jgi:hypothetical protein
MKKSVKDFGDELITVGDLEQLGYSREWLRAQGLPRSGWISRLELESLVQGSLRRTTAPRTP